MKNRTVSLLLAGTLACSSAALFSGCGKPYYSDQFSNIKWPDSKLAKMLPEPESTIGKIETDSADRLEVCIGKTTADQYENYLSSCKENGFTENYYNGSLSDYTYYRAENAEGYSLTLQYHSKDNNSAYKPLKETMKIELHTPSEKEEDTEHETEKPTEKPAEKPTEKETEKPKENSESSKSESRDSGEISNDFREMMDSYEAFFDEYVAFMKRYKENPSDLSLLSEYADYMSKYSDYLDKLDDIEQDELTDAELAYYMEVHSRILKKIADAT